MSPGTARGRALLVVAAALVLVGSGCAATGSGDSGDPAAESSSPESPSESLSESPSPSGSPSGSPRQELEVPADDPPPCDDVRAGIDAFNEGDPQETVRRFEAAVADAERYAAEAGTREADLLLEAVRYYVDLPAEDYQEALTSSPEFKRHQVVTLAMCRYGTGPTPQDEESDTVPA